MKSSCNWTGAPCVSISMRGQGIPIPLALVLLSVAAKAGDPDPVEIGRKSVQANAENRKKAHQYAYRQYYVNRELNDKGKETGRQTKTWDVIGLEGSTYKKLVMKDDKPLSPKDQKGEDDRQHKEAELRRKETPEQRQRRLFSLTYSYFLPYDKLVDIFDLKYLGEEEMNGSRTWVIEATPKPGFQAATEDEKESLNYKFKFWLDQTDYCAVRLDGEIVGDRSRLQKGTYIREDGAKQNDGVWLPKTTTIRYAARVLKMFNVHGEAVTTYSDFHKFQVDSGIVELSEKR